MSQDTGVRRATVRLERSIYDVLVGVVLENHLVTPRRGPNVTAAIRWLVLDWQRMRSQEGEDGARGGHTFAALSAGSVPPVREARGDGEANRNSREAS